jgi:putative glycosyltransferase
MKLSIVATLYQSAPYIEEFYQRASAVARTLTHDYEIVLVNDGSPDDSLGRAVALTTQDRHVVVVDLSRNFGHHKAMIAGLAQARGESIFLIDSDLEEEPEWLLSFANQMETDLCDVVYGVQEKRKGGLFERWSGQLYYSMFQAITGLDIPHSETTARLMKRDYVDSLLLFEEREMEIGLLWFITGYNQKSQLVKKHSTSNTTYTFKKKISLVVNAITSFSNAPLIWIFYLGILVLLFDTFYLGYLILHRIMDQAPIDGWTSVMFSIWLLGGVILSSIGVVGIYLAKVFSETKRRPNAIIRKIYGQAHAQ